MSLVALWESSKDQIRRKAVHQIIAIAGDGRLRDGSDCSIEFNEFLKLIPSDLLLSFSKQCLEESFKDSGLVLQELVNEIGRRLGFKVNNGRLRGTQNHIGYDGLWEFSDGHRIIVEVKTTDTYRIDLNTLEGYRKKLIKQGSCTEENSSILIVVGRQDTGDLEAQIRGSKQAWDVRLISVDSISKLMLLKEDLDNPYIVQQIHSILIPREFTRLDEIVDIMFLASEDIKEDTDQDMDSEADDANEKREKTTRVSFHASCIEKMAKYFKRTLIKRSRTGFSSANDEVAVICANSREYVNPNSIGYWFSIHRHQLDFLEKAEAGYILLGCGSDKLLLLIPVNDFLVLTERMNMSKDENRQYWHVHMSQTDKIFTLHTKSDSDDIDITKYLLETINIE